MLVEGRNPTAQTHAAGEHELDGLRVESVLDSVELG